MSHPWLSLALQMVGTQQHNCDFGVVNEAILLKMLKMSIDLSAVIQWRNTDLALKMSENVYFYHILPSQCHKRLCSTFPGWLHEDVTSAFGAM